jgi:uncharacterized repeat protein (TIGR01451 family)
MRFRIVFAVVLSLLLVHCGDSPVEPVVQHNLPSFATSTSADGLVITTDKDDYSPGDTVHFTGSGWPANDVLNIVLVDDAVTQETHTWTVNVAEDGTFQDSTYVVDTNDFGVTFTLTATSQTDGRSLTVVFTDGNIRVRTNITGITANVTTRTYTNTTCTGNVSGSTTSMTSTLTSVALGVNPGASVKLTAASSSNTGAFIEWSSNDAFTPVTGDPQSICISGFNGNSNHDFTANYQAADLTVDKSHTGNFQVGVNGSYTLAVTNQGSAATSGAITLTDNLPTGLTFVSGSGSGWGNCTAAGQAVSCTRSGQIMPGNSSPVSLVVGVAAAAAPSVTNTASIGGGNEPSGNAGNNSDSDPTTVTSAVAGPTKLAFTTAAFSRVVNACSPQISVQTQNAANAPTSPTTATTVNLTSSSTGAGGGAYFSDNTCTTGITSVSIPTSGNTASFFYKDGTVGTPTLTAAATGLTSATQQETITAAPNAAPSVSAGGPYSGAEGDAIALSPTVTDPDGDVLAYKWTVNNTGIDAGGACTFDDDAQKNAHVTCTDDSQGGTGGKFSVTLTVDDGHGHSVPASTDLTVTNANPSATAGGPYTGNEGSAIQLNGSGDDPGNNDDAHLTYKWTANITGIDIGGDCTFDDDTKRDAKVTCTDDSQDATNGHFVLSLVVKDDDGGTSSTSTANLTVSNAKPVADAGGGTNGYAGNEGAAIQLSGSANDPGDNDDPTLTYHWTADVTGIDAGGQCTFDNADSKTAKVTCTDDGSFKVKLVATDDDGASSTESVANLTVANVDPVAHAGGPYSGNEGSAIKLHGSATDAGTNDTFLWKWEYTAGEGFINGATCSFDNATLQEPNITCNDNGTVKLTLVVKDDNGGESDPSEATLNVLNVDPVADAGGGTNGYSGSEGSPVHLYGSATDAGSNDTFTWSWQYVGLNIDPGATCSFNDPLAKQPTVTCTDNGTVKLTLTVHDDDGGSDTDDATLTLANVAPVANAGGGTSGYSGAEGDAIQLNGSATDQGANDKIAYKWTATATGIDAGGACSFDDDTKTNAKITCTDDANGGHFTVSLVATDDDGGVSVASTANLTVTNANPVADAGTGYSGNEGTAVSLTGTESDPGTNDQLTHSWSYTTGSGVDAGATCSFSPSNTALSPTIKCTDDGTYQVSLTVNDDDGGSSTSNASLTLANVDPVISSFTQADPNSSALPSTVVIGGTLNLRAVFSDLGTNDTYTGQVDCGTGSYGNATSTSSPYEPSCTFSSIGPKTIKVKVSDDDNGSAEVTKNITVVYNFAGFSAPVDRPNIMNVSKAGQAIPLKWRLTDALGRPITDLTSVAVQVGTLNCDLGTSQDVIEEYAAGASGLQNLGDGYYQFNWKTPTSYAGTCKTTALTFGAGGLAYTEKPAAYFTFKK